MLIFLGIVGIVVAIIALVKGSFPLLGIKTRKVGAVVLVVSIIAFSAGVSPSDTVKETVSENKHVEQNDPAIREEAMQNVFLQSVKTSFEGIADVELYRREKVFKLIPLDESIVFGLMNPSSEVREV